MDHLSGQFNYPTNYRIGAGRIRELSEVCGAAGLARPLLVTDPGITALPWFNAIVDDLKRAGLEVAVFSEIDANPSTRHIAAGLEQREAHAADGCILIGGGSALDAGKCIALLADNPGSVLDYVDEGDRWKQAEGDRILPTIAVPTTAGTGSEVGRAAVIVNPEDQSKQIIFHPQLQPDFVVADPELTVGLPPRLTAATGMDALAHCFEAYCAPGYHPMADGIALEGLRLIGTHLVRAYQDGQDLVARTHLLMAASMGATAFQKGLGLIHALSHPLGGVTGLHHGTANAIFQPYVMVHNREAIQSRMPRLAQTLGLDIVMPNAASGTPPDPEHAFDAVLAWTLDLRQRLELPHTLEGSVDPALIDRLVPMAEADPSLATNPKRCNRADLKRVFTKALAGDLTP